MVKKEFQLVAAKADVEYLPPKSRQRNLRSCYSCRRRLPSTCIWSASRLVHPLLRNKSDLVIHFSTRLRTILVEDNSMTPVMSSLRDYTIRFLTQLIAYILHLSIHLILYRAAIIYVAILLGMFDTSEKSRKITEKSEKTTVQAPAPIDLNYNSPIPTSRYWWKRQRISKRATSTLRTSRVMQIGALDFAENRQVSGSLTRSWRWTEIDLIRWMHPSESQSARSLKAIIILK
jgi:hypothetical protein